MSMQRRPVMFGDLRVGEHFIGWPIDNEGCHNPNGNKVFRKIEPVKVENFELYENAYSIHNECNSVMPDSMYVMRVVL